MGIDRTDYIVFGYKLPAGVMDGFDYLDERLLPMIEGHRGEDFTLLNGYGNSGEYHVFGQKIAHAGEYWDFRNIDTSVMDIGRVKSRYSEVFSVDVSEVPNPTLFIFSHFS